MSKTESALRANLDKGKPNLIGYFPLGFPNLDASIEACIEMCKSGIDVLELGIPYSDPVMDGVEIQEATEMALQNGFKLSQTFDALKRIASAVGGLKDAGGAGLITPDLIPDEAGEWLAIAEQLDLDRVFLATPSSSSSRVDTASEVSRGFTYAVSTMGITGERAELDQLARTVVKKIRDSGTAQLAAVGIGISTAEQVREVNSYADAAIVGSAFVRAYSRGGLSGLKDKVRELSQNVEI